MNPGLPVMIDNACVAWPAMTSWSVDSLVKDFGACEFSVGDTQASVQMRLSDYVGYVSGAATLDDNPLYLFETLCEPSPSPSSEEPSPSPRQSSEDQDDDAAGQDQASGDESKSESATPHHAAILAAFTPLPYFSEDLFSAADPDSRPGYRWMMCGGARSGTNIHTDPFATSAWNTVIIGHKRWVLFPPETPEQRIKLLTSTLSSESADVINNVCRVEAVHGAAGECLL